MIKKTFLILFVFNLLFSGSITFQVDMQNQSMDNGAYIVGTWDYVFYQMSPVGNSGTYTYIAMVAIVIWMVGYCSKAAKKLK